MNIEDIAQYYIATPNTELSSSVIRSFRQFIVDLAQVELQGIDCQYVDFVPYMKGAELCLEDIHADFNQGKLLISTQFNNSDLLGSDVNMLFRCIHEVHHLKLNVDFGLEGEFATAAHIISLTDNLLFKQLLFSETLGQISVRICTEKFPDYQKVILFNSDVLRCLNKDWKFLTPAKSTLKN
ncbi:MULTISPECIES: hypothetical protein [unclassified Coleofasciculus]|uniref:hypothetical protein n=1 Tax=unclassified Coleofasciculus TaxID=2692782 RepID=UPI0018828F43|nr:MULTISPECIES: hypothetical protein [unclassified Coleofasciculus]MBE9129337.1 hypothetical protein [Coleofasciculus sp. LEGE 07081]MBE9147617.1 hypothetical protein [Coleofasciculus sp. LEGE 07092]